MPSTALPVNSKKAVARIPAQSSNHRATSHRRNHQRDIGMLMLLLAAETVVSVAHPRQVMATEMLAAAIQLGYNVPTANSSSFSTSQNDNSKLLEPRTPHVPSLGGETESSDESEVPEDHATATPTVNGSSFGWIIGEMPSTNTPKKTHDTATIANSSLLERSTMHLSDSAATTRTSSRGGDVVSKPEGSVSKASIVLSNNNIIISSVVSFLSWREVVALRGVSKQWFQATLNVVSICRMPVSGAPALFIPYPASDVPTASSHTNNYYRSHNGNHLNHNATPEPLYWSSQTTAWMCPNCCATNSPARASCPRYGCGALSPATWDSQRLFFGQLRRDGTIPFVLWVLRDVAGIADKDIRSIENHRDKLTGRGKGCAWVTVSTHLTNNSSLSASPSLTSANSAAEKLLSLHHRAFFDTIHGVEGLWLTIPKTREELDCEASMRVTSNNNADGFKAKYHHEAATVSSHPSLPQNHPRHMPRSSVVVEATNPTQNTLTVNHFLGRGRNFPIHYIRGENGKIRYVHNPYFQCAPIPQSAISKPEPLITSPAVNGVEAL